MLEKVGNRMLVAERQQKIVEIVNKEKSVRVADLSKRFSVTEETIRRDLEKLEVDKKLIRSHGGAVPIERQDDEELPFTRREITNVTEKKEMARLAVKHVQEGDTIMLDASSTAWYMAKILPNRPLTVVTNAIKVVLELSGKSKINVISIGGTVLSDSLSFVGPLATTSLESYFVNKAFISCKGLHLTRGLTESDERQALVKRKMIEMSDISYVMLDHTKFAKQAFSRLSPLEKIEHIITDQQTDPRILDELKEQGVNVHVSN